MQRTTTVLKIEQYRARKLKIKIQRYHTLLCEKQKKIF